MKKFFNEHRDVLMLILRCAVATALLIIAVVNYDKLTKIDMRALVAGAGSTAAAVAVIIGVFAVKSVLFIIPASMIYIYVGMAFPTASAIAINLAGIALEITVTYLLGWFLGGEYVEKRLKGSKAGDKAASPSATERSSRRSFSCAFCLCSRSILSAFSSAQRSCRIGNTR